MLADGEKALVAANKALALERFGLALQIDRQNAAALKGRERAAKLDKVLPLVAQGAELERAADWQGAARAYAAALALDPEWRAAREGRDRVAATLAGN